MNQKNKDRNMSKRQQRDKQRESRLGCASHAWWRAENDQPSLGCASQDTPNPDFAK